MTEEEQQRAAEERRIREDADLTTVMSTQAGRRFVWRILDELAGVLNGSFVSDPHATAFNEGRRSVGLALTVELQRVVPGSYVHMLTEHLASSRQHQRDATDERRQLAADDGNDDHDR